MGYQLKIILTVLMVLILAGLAGVGIRYATKQPDGAEVTDNKQDKESASQPSKGDDRVEGAGDEVSTGGETAVAKAIEPSFDIVRVEPTGEVVAAGQAAAGARIELLLGDKAIASAVANAGGEWALVFDEPLAPGSYDLLLRATGPGGEGDMVDGDRVTVVIETPEKTPLVAVTRPGEPTKVLQTPGSTSETVVAEASKTDEAGTAPVDSSEQAPPEQPVTQDQQMAAVEPDAGKGATDTEAQADKSADSATGRAAPQEPAAAVDKAVASAQPAPETSSSETVASEANVAIETVEVENSNRLMLGGRADAGNAVRLYLNNEPLGDAETGADGRWTLTTERPMPPGRYELRADVVGGDGGVKGRAKVRFDRVQMVEAGQQAPEANASTTGGGAAGSSGQGSDVTIVSRTSGVGGTSSTGAVGEGAGTSVVVIARGDNLWSIARKIYGQGVRHTMIFEANKNQIGNPNLIYPGQVFTIPVLEDDANQNG